MNAPITNLDDHRRKSFEWLICLHCLAQDSRVVIAGQRYYDCRGCDEISSISVWQWRYGR